MAPVEQGSFLTNRVANRVLIPLLSGPAGRWLGRGLAVVSYDGRRTGRPYRLVAQVVVDGLTVRIGVSRPGRKTWWRNFTSPYPVRLRFAGREHAALAHVERDGGLVRVVAELTGRDGITAS